jgi:hypothetical protein
MNLGKITAETKKRSFAVVLSLTSVCLCGLFAATAQGADFQATKTSGAITIDGKLNEAAWQKAPQWGGFSPLGTRGDSTAPVPTQFKLLADDQAIYIGVSCDEPLMKDLKAVPSLLNSLGLFNNDCVEIFVDPTGRGAEFYQLAFSAANSQFALYYIEGGNTTGGYYAPVLESAVNKGEKGWTLEVKIPLSAFYYTDSGRFSDTWRLNVARERVTVSPRELSSWSKLKRAFAESANFNSVSGMPRKDARFDVRLGSASAGLTPAGEGRYTGSVTFQTVAGDGAVGQDTLSISTDGKALASGPVKITSGKGEVTLGSVSFAALGKLNLLAELRDSAGQVVHQQNLPLEVKYEPLAIDVTSPFYANCIFPGEDLKEIAGTVLAGLPADQLDGAKVVVKLQGAKSDQATADFKSTSAQFALDARDLPVGDYPLVVQVVRDGKTLAQKTVTIRKLAKPANTSVVYIDKDLNVVVNGKPMFVRGWYGDSVYAMSTALLDRLGNRPASKFVNAWECLMNMEAERLDPTQEGQRITEDVKPSQKVFDEMLKNIEKVKNDPSVWWYYLCDEPECRGVSPVYLKYQYDFIKKHDPYHPVMIISREPDKFTHCADILNPHPYLNPVVDSSGQRSLTSPKNIRDQIRTVLSSGKGRIPAWLTPQSFSYGMIDTEARYPTFVEFRCMIYDAVANGAKGFTPFMYSEHFNTVDLRQGVPFIYETLAKMNEFLISPAKPMAMKVSAPDDGVDAWAKTVDGTTLLVAVNLLDKPVTAEISSEGLKNVSNLVGFRQEGGADVSDGTVKLQFKPYQAQLLSSKKIDGDLKTVDAFEKELAAANAALAKPGNILFGKGREIEWDVSSAWSGLGGALNTMFSLCDGMTDCYGWVSDKYGPAWIGMIFPDFVPKFKRARIYGANIEQVQLMIWKRGDWQKAGTADWKKGSAFVEINMPSEVTTVKMKLEMTKVTDGHKAEVYEVELYQ